MKTKGNQGFYRMVLALVIPIALQNLINVAVQSADVIMLGRLENSEIVLSAASLAGQICFIMNLIFFGLTSGVSVLVAQYWGKQDMKAIETVLGIAMRISIVVSIFFMAASLVATEPIMQIFSSNADVVAESVKYLRIVCISFIFISFTMVYLNVMRSMERVIVSTVIYFISLLINIVLNWIFIFGKLGMPAMGIEGAAVATVIARISEFVMVLIYDRKWNQILHFKWKLLFVKNKQLTRDFLVFSGPVVLNELFWGGGIATNAAILGNMGSAASAASSVVQVVRQLAMVLSLGIASATAVILGKVIGENRLDTARAYGGKFVKLGVISGLFGSAIVMIARPIVLATMNLEGEAYTYLGQMMLVLSYYVVAQSFSTTMIVGVFRAGGDTKYGLFVDLLTLWGCSILFGMIAAFVLDWGVIPVYVIIMMDEVLKIPLVIYRYRTYKWLNNITRQNA